MARSGTGRNDHRADTNHRSLRAESGGRRAKCRWPHEPSHVGGEPGHGRSQMKRCSHATTAEREARSAAEPAADTNRSGGAGSNRFHLQPLPIPLTQPAKPLDWEKPAETQLQSLHFELHSDPEQNDLGSRLRGWVLS